MKNEQMAEKIKLIRDALNAMHSWVEYHHGCKACFALLALQDIEKHLEKKCGWFK